MTRVHVIEDTVDPSLAPDYVGQHWVNTTTSKHWLAKGTATVADWVEFNFTLPALTAGSVLFSDGTTIAQDNAHLFWDNTNNRLAINTNTFTSSTARLEVYGADDLDTSDIIVAYANNLTQGFAIRYNGLYAVGSNSSVDIALYPKGGANVITTGGFVSGSTSYSTLGGLRISGHDASNTIYAATSAIGITTNGGVQGLSVGFASATTSIFGAGATDGTFSYHAYLNDSTAMAAGVGGGIAFAGQYGIGVATFSGIKGVKKNASSGDFAGELAFYTRQNGGSLLERMRIDDAGLVTSTGTISAPNLSALSLAATNIATTGTINNQAVATRWLVFTGASSVTLTGLVAQTDGTEIVVTNRLSNSSATVGISHESASSTAANRVTNPDGGAVNIKQYQSYRLRYVGATSRWISANSFVYPSPIGSSANANGFTTTGNALVLQPASGSFGGVLTTGTQTIAGLKNFNGGIGVDNITGVGGSQAIAPGVRYLINGSSLTVLDWNLCALYDASSVISSDWTNRYFYDSSGVQSGAWSVRNLFDSSTVLSVDWSGRFLSDSVTQYSLHWGVRQTYDNGGAQSIDWDGKFLTASGNQYFAWGGGIGFFSTAAQPQQNTGGSSASYSNGGGTGLTDTDTFDGYTLAQIVYALRVYGLLA